jgi:hypothetical protein
MLCPALHTVNDRTNPACGTHTLRHNKQEPDAYSQRIMPSSNG